MTQKNLINNFLKKIYQLLIIGVSMAGFVPKNATIPRTIVMVFSLIFAIYLNNFQSGNSTLAIIYFTFSEVFYISFLMIVLTQNGLRHWFIKKWNSEEGYLTYEAILGFLFFHNLISIGYIASSSPDNLFHFMDKDILGFIVLIMFIGGFAIKVLATQAVSIEIYYLKDMFLGKKITNFVETGPYKYFSNPMYGVGQLQAYATAIWYGSTNGLIAAFVNQFLVFTFYYLFEKKFIRRTYLK